MISNFDLTDRIALLTGATGHLGQAVARGLCKAGALVLINGRSREKVAQLVTALNAQDCSAMPATFDITDGSQRRGAIQEISQKYGRLDILINNAISAPPTEGSAAFESVYKTAVISSWDLVQESLDLLRIAASRNTGGASVINIASMYGLVSPDFRIYGSSTPRNPPFYGAAKAGLIQLTRYLACELGPEKIRVNAVSPGPFPNPSLRIKDPEFVENLGKKNPLGRIGEPDELVGPIVFLASDAASYVTGSNLAVDGGWTAW